jgi:hypothetical protein
MVPSQPRQKKFVRPHLNGIKLDVVMHTYQPSKGKKHKIGGSWSRLAWTKSETPFPK